MMNGLIGLLVCICLCAAAKFFASYVNSREFKGVNLLANIDQKLFMTALLGFFYAGFFVILCCCAGRFLERDFLLRVFAYGIENPKSFFYFAAGLFVANALFITLVRAGIKRIYRRI